jgi:hypothetical protein
MPRAPARAAAPIPRRAAKSPHPRVQFTKPPALTHAPTRASWNDLNDAAACHYTAVVQRTDLLG